MYENQNELLEKPDEIQIISVWANSVSPIDKGWINRVNKIEIKRVIGIKKIRILKLILKF